MKDRITYRDYFEIPVVPRAWARTGGRGTQRFETKDQRAAKRTLEALLLEHRPPRILTGPIILGVKAFFPIPPGWPQWKQWAAREGLWHHATVPDLSNIIKLVEDVMKGTFFVDDRQVFRYEPAPEGGYSVMPRWEISIIEVALPTCEEVVALRKEKEAA